MPKVVYVILNNDKEPFVPFALLLFTFFLFLYLRVEVFLCKNNIVSEQTDRAKHLLNNM